MSLPAQINLSQDTCILIWTKQVSCLRVKPASASPMAKESPGSRRRPGGSASQAGFGSRGNGGVQSGAPQASRLSVGGRAGGSEAASPPGEGALFPRRRAWLTEQRIRRRAGGARGTQQSHSPAGAGAPEPKEGEEEEEEVKEEAAAGSCLILPGSADPLAAAGWGWPPSAGPGARRSCPRPPLARCARSRVLSGRRPGAPHAPRRGSAAGPPGGSAEGKREREKERESAQSCTPRGPGRREPGRTAPPHPPRRCAPRSAPGGTPSPRNFSTWPVGGRGRGRCPALRASPTPCPSPGPRAQLTGGGGGGDGDRGGGAPTRPRAERCAPAGEEEGAGGGVGVPSREGHLGGGDRRGLRHPGRGPRASRGLQPRWERVREPPPASRGAAADGARGLPRPRVCGANPVT